MGDESNDSSWIKQNVNRVLLQFILRNKGVVYEGVLVQLLKQLDRDNDECEQAETVGDVEWQHRLSQHVAEINVKLSRLNFKIVKVRHGMGKRYVSQIMAPNWVEGSTIVSSSLFYVYVNLSSTKEMNLATSLKSSEIEVVKWIIDKLATLRAVAEETDQADSHVKECVNSIIKSCFQDDTEVSPFLSYCSTYSTKSMELLNYAGLAASEVERLLNKLCELKWLHKLKNGAYALDLKALIELEDYLLETYGMLTCQSCQRIATVGVYCTACTRVLDGHGKASAWHVDCFEHHLNHVSKLCRLCDSPLLDFGGYLQ